MNSIGPVGGASGGGFPSGKKFPLHFLRKSRKTPPEKPETDQWPDELDLSDTAIAVSIIRGLTKAQVSELLEDQAFRTLLESIQAEARGHIETALRQKLSES